MSSILLSATKRFSPRTRAGTTSDWSGFLPTSRRGSCFSKPSWDAPTMAHHLKVLIIGAGTGGLCLAQGLKKDGVAVEVFERDHTPTDRLQGYRLSLNATGNRALRECLPDPVFNKLVQCSAQPSQRVSFQDHRLNRLLAVDLPHNGGEPLETEHPVSRTALRH